MSQTKRTRHTASFLLSHFLNSKDSLEQIPWVTGNLVSILRYMYDVMEMNYTRSGLCICDKSISQIATYSRTSAKTVERSLPLFVQKDLLNVERRKPRTPTHFGIGKLLLARVIMTPELSTGDIATVTMTPALPSPRRQQTPNWGHHDATSNKAFKKDSKKESVGRQKRAPLSLSFEPNKELKATVIMTAAKVGLTPEQLLTKFKNIQISKDKVSADWNAELENFLITERPAQIFGAGRANLQVITTPAAHKWFEPADWQKKLRAERELKEASQGGDDEQKGNLRGS